MFTVLCFVQLFLEVGSAAAGTSVDGFFPDDYVKGGYFSEAQSGNASATSDGQSAISSGPQQQGARTPQQPASRVRGYPGRFTKTTRGVQSNRVRGDASDPSSEWDVSNSPAVTN